MAGSPGDSCADTDCVYGSECVEGQCVPLCPEGEVYCQGGCIDPLTEEKFCGATAGCDAGEGPNPVSGMGGAGGGAGLGRETAGEHCDALSGCVEGNCKPLFLVPGSDAVVERDGFAVRCTQWDGAVCVKPWIRIGASRVVAQGSAEGCIDDTTSLRPIWYYDMGDAEAQTFCQVAVGTSNAQFSNTNGPNESLSGWMYGAFTSGSAPAVQCDDSGFRNYSEVDSPGELDNVIWSFDVMSEVRTGRFLTIECEWP
jgi:hypothetical protein